MKRAPLNYRRPPWPPEKLARLCQIEREFHEREFGEELARVNLDLSMEERLRYLEWMRNLGRRHGLRFSRDLESVEKELLDGNA
jgi:hypothetical protein